MKICDCTLRDGGYYTNWDFSKELFHKYLRLVESIDSIEIIELGYRSKKMQKYFGEYFYCPEYVIKEAREIAPSKNIAIMLNEKSIEIADLDEILSPCVGLVDIVRLAVNPINIDRAIDLSIEIKKMGFGVALNLMYMSNWADDDLFIEKLINVDGIVDFLYLVDSFGSVLPEDVESIFCKLKYISKTKIGFHGHDNLECSLINSIKAYRNGAYIVDSTITGMGRGAGNLKTELLLTYMNSKHNIAIDFTYLSGLVSIFSELQDKYKWGTSFPYMISGAFSLPQEKVMGWIVKNRHTVPSIVNALQNSKNNIVDNKDLKKFDPVVTHKEVVIVGGGKSSISVLSAVEKYVNKFKGEVAIVHAGGRYVGQYANIKVKQYYCLVGSEALKLETSFNGDYVDGIYIVGPYPRPMGTILSDFMKDVFELKQIEYCSEYNDSLLAISLQVAIELGAEIVSLIGFDGYDNNNDKKMIEVAAENQYILNQFSKYRNNIRFLTPSTYNYINQESIYCYL